MTKNKPEMDNPVFDTILALEPILPILSSTAAGYVNGGWIGCGAGFVASIVDVAAQHYELYDKPYLTAGVLGYSALAVFKMPVVLNNMLSTTVFYSVKNTIGFALGVTIATGQVNEYLEYIPSPIKGAIYGYSCRGWIGAGAGLVAGMIDENLSRYNITHKYWLTGVMYGAAAAILTVPTSKRLPKGILGATAALYYQYTYGSTTFQRWSPFALQDELYKLYGSVIPKPELDSLVSTLAITTVAAQLSIQVLFATLLERRQLMNQQFFVEVAGIEQGNVWPNYLDGFSRVTLQLLPLWIAGSCVSELLKMYANTKLTYQTTDAVVTLLYKNEAVLRLEKMHVGNGTRSDILIKNMYKDIAKTNEGASLFAQAMSLVIRGYHNGGFLINANANDMIIYSFIFHSITYRITAFLAANHHKDTALLDTLVAQGDSVVEHLRVNALVLTQEGRTSFMHLRHQNNTRVWRLPYGYKLIFGTLIKSWSEFKGWANFFYNHMITFKLILDRTISLDASAQVLLLAGDTVNLVSWESDNSASLIEIRLAMSRLGDLIARLKSTDSTTIDDRTTDYGDGHRVHREYLPSQRKQVCLKDFSVGIKNTGFRLTWTESLCVYGPVVAVTGASGGGKSTALQIIGGIRHAGSWGNGTISFATKDARKSVIITVSQDMTTIPYVMWLEDITCMLDPKAREYETLIRDVMGELLVDAGANASLADALYKPTHSVSLSGGQKKKVAVLRAIVKTAASDGNIYGVILDEPFVGLDDDSVVRMQRAIKKYWPNSIIMIVDHKAEDNSLLGIPEGFYNDRINFNNVTKTIEFIPLKLNDLSDTPSESGLQDSSDTSTPCPSEENMLYGVCNIAVDD